MGEEFCKIEKPWEEGFPGRLIVDQYVKLFPRSAVFTGERDKIVSYSRRIPSMCISCLGDAFAGLLGFKIDCKRLPLSWRSVLDDRLKLHSPLDFLKPLRKYRFITNILAYLL
jgi:hypothetical protein